MHITSASCSYIPSPNTLLGLLSVKFSLSSIRFQEVLLLLHSPVLPLDRNFPYYFGRILLQFAFVVAFLPTPAHHSVSYCFARSPAILFLSPRWNCFLFFSFVGHFVWFGRCLCLSFALGIGFHGVWY
ncbi:hypothetical protein BJ508DRAFT_144294 [Ascobolus immersus RN42]|uniref:Uncharacterized protein n=1 Tax=Ascobolus immersus RN42 TaxID=1160509 RepID=A0A3N4HZ62_ASCIM|nr:hypothetical protein BJ508DRAFT_144294 [Ascobolus immersus RN42]